MSRTKILSTVFFLIIISSSLFAQTSSNPIRLPDINLLSHYDLYMESEKINAYSYKFKLIDKKNPNIERVFQLAPLDKDAFVFAFKGNLDTLLTAAGRMSLNDTAKINREALRVFWFVQSSGITIGQLNFAPEAGTITFNQQVEIRTAGSTINPAREELRLLYKIEKVNKEKINKKKEENEKDGKKIRTGDHCISKLDTITKKAQLKNCYKKRKIARDQLEYFIDKDLSDQKNIQIKSFLNVIAATTGLNNEMMIEGSTYLDKLHKMNPNILKSENYAKGIDSIKIAIESIWPDLFLGCEQLGYTVTNLKVNKPKSYHLSFRFNPEFQLDHYSKKLLSIQDLVSDFGGVRLENAYVNKNLERYEKLLDIAATNKARGNQALYGIKGIDRDFFRSWSNLISMGIQIDPKASDISENDLWFFGAELAKFKNDVIKKAIAIEDFEKIAREYQKLELNLTVFEKFIEGVQPSVQTKKSIQDSIKYINVQIAKNNSLIEEYRLKIDSVVITKPIQQFEVEYVNLEFNQGYIEHIVVFGHVLNKTEDKIKFVNVVPIGFSRESDFKRLKDILLFTESANTNRPQYKMRLDQLIPNYEQNIALNRRDFSPKDMAVKYVLNGTTKEVLKKDQSYQLFETKIYSDFIGLEESEPNGLIQLEFDKQINLITHRLGVPYPNLSNLFNLSKKITSNHDYFNVGIFGYVTPSLVISKIEKNNRTLQLQSRDRFVNNQYFQERFASTLDLRNYENLSLGLDLNLLTIDFPNIKSTLRGDMGFRYGRTQVSDSIRALDANGVPSYTGEANVYGINTFRWYPSFIWQVKPEERYGLQVEYFWNWHYAFTPDVKQVAISSEFAHNGTNNKANRYNTIVLEAYFNPSVDNPTGKLFFRYSFNHMTKRWNTNFHQAQLGYSFFLLGRNKTKN